MAVSDDAASAGQAAGRAVEPGVAVVDPHVDRFVDAIWLEDGLSDNTLAAYRRDLTALAVWLRAHAGQGLLEASESDLQAYMLARHGESRPASVGRRLSVFRRFYRWAIREHLCQADPTVRMDAPRQRMRLPGTLTEDQVEQLLAAPDPHEPLGLRDRAMLELMYASGLRVSELVGLRTVQVSLDEEVLRVTGKGSKERLVPFGQEASGWLLRYLNEARPQILSEGRSLSLIHI